MYLRTGTTWTSAGTQDGFELAAPAHHERSPLAAPGGQTTATGADWGRYIGVWADTSACAARGRRRRADWWPPSRHSNLSPPWYAVCEL